MDNPLFPLKEQMKLAYKFTKLPIEYLRTTKTVIRDNDYKSLLEHLKTRGLLNPLTVVEIGVNNYEVVEGNKRLACAFALNWKTLDCVVVSNR